MLFRKVCSLVLLLLLSHALFCQNKKPNVVFVVVDDIGPAWISPYAAVLKKEDVEPEITELYRQQQKVAAVDVDKHIEAARNAMPFLNQLAKRGLVFNKCFTSAAVCAPSRAGMLTGRYSQNWGAYSLTEIEMGGIPGNVPFLPEAFSSAGYNMAAIGKWHLGPHDAKQKQILDDAHFKSSAAPGVHPLDRGFNYFYGYNNAFSIYDGAPDLWENRQPVAAFSKDSFLTEILNHKARNFIAANASSGKPFFLYYAPMTLHGGVTPSPQKYRSKFNTGIDFTDTYAGHLLALDEGLKEIYDEIKRQGKLDNTLFVLCSDNGAPYPVPPYNAPFKGGKGSGWLGGSHSPLIVVAPGMTKGGFSDELVSCLDILPTLIDIAGLKVPPGLDGKSLKGVLQGNKKAHPHDVIYSAGLHSARWSYSYFAASLKKNQDNQSCPVYLLGISDNQLYMSLSEVPAGLYEKLPNGQPAQASFYNYVKDPKTSQPLTPSATTIALQQAAINWLKKCKPPIRDRKDAYEKLTVAKNFN